MCKKTALMSALLALLLACAPAADSDPMTQSKGTHAAEDDHDPHDGNDRGPGGHADDDHEDDHGEEEHDDEHVEIPPAVRRNLGITFAEVELRYVADTLRLPGAFELEPLARQEYHLALPGRVELLVDQYERVEVGQPLFRFESPVWPELLHEIILAEQDIATSVARIEVARAKLEESSRMLELMRERLEALARADFKRADLEARATEFEAGRPRIEAELRLAQTQLVNARRTREHALHRAAAASGFSEEELAREVLVGGELVPTYETIEAIEVRAAAAGVVEVLNATTGAYLESAEQVLATIDPARVRFRAQGLQSDLEHLIGAAKSRIVPPRSAGTPISTAVDAMVELGLEADPEARTVTVLATPLAEAAWGRAGVSAFLEIVVASSGGPAPSVPRSAVVQAGLTHVVFKRNPEDPDEALRVEVRLGVSDGRWVALESGVSPGDVVVLDGVYELKLATERGGSTAPGGHFHADGSFHGEDH